MKEFQHTSQSDFRTIRLGRLGPIPAEERRLRIKREAVAMLLMINVLRERFGSSHSP